MRNRTCAKRHIAVQKLLNEDFCSPYYPIDNGEDDRYRSRHDNKGKKIGFMDAIKNIFAVIKGEKDTKGTYTVGTFSFLLFWLFKAIGGVGMFATVSLGFADVVAIISCVKTGCNDVGQICFLFIALGIIVMFFLYSVMVWGAAKEIEEEKDKNYVLAVFSGVVSFASLVVAIITFFREVR
ncbi:MAG: hypothetical protein IKT52_01910 [Oscillospiraceae bacterium]|nr:hypothetical protein [Oscillospiraceae bacterium]